MRRAPRSQPRPHAVPRNTVVPAPASRPTRAALLPWRRLADFINAKPLGWVLKLGLSAGLIAFLCRHIDGAALFESFTRQSPGWVFATAAIGVVQIALLTLRWQQILRALGARSGLGSALAVTYMGAFFGAILFGPAGSDVARAMLAPARSLGRKGIVHSVLFERLASVIGLGLAATPLVLLATGPFARSIPLIALAVLSFPFLAMALLAWAARATARRGGALFVALREFEQSRQRLCRTWPRFVAAVAMAAAGQVLVAAEAWCLSQSQHLGVAFIDFVMLMPPVMLLVALPVSAGGWGVREGAMVAALGLVGVGREPALLLSVELGVLWTLVALPGGAIWLHRCFTRRPQPVGV
jgi:glycosyltransferase 2 family protein